MKEGCKTCHNVSSDAEVGSRTGDDKMRKPDFSLRGKIALITGGGRIIGKAATLGFAKASADVIVASRKLSGLNSIYE